MCVVACDLSALHRLILKFSCHFLMHLFNFSLSCVGMDEIYSF